ncbi:hypothetical protein OAO87_03300 [bacterium]|nr:hypothetical protein [bacterium]
MPYHLVDEKRVLHVLADEEAFRRYVAQRKDLKLSNMLELIGVGRGVAAKEKKNHMLLNDVICLERDGIAGVIPLVGSYGHMHKTLQQHHNFSLAYDTTKDLFNGKKTQVKDKDKTVWRKTSLPSMMQLTDGASLVDLMAAAAAMPGPPPAPFVLPDYGGGLGAGGIVSLNQVSARRVTHASCAHRALTAHRARVARSPCRHAHPSSARPHRSRRTGVPR